MQSDSCDRLSLTTRGAEIYEITRSTASRESAHAFTVFSYLDRSDRDPAWAKETVMQLTRPLLTCEAVIAEALFLLRRGGIDPDGLLNLMLRGLVVPEFSLAKQIGAIHHLMKNYRNIPMSLADACLVRMAEIHPNAKVMTSDSDFSVYRKSRRKVIPLLRPER